jgi:hypothetical protein
MQEKQGQGSQGDMDKKSQDQTGTQGGQGDLDKKSDQGDFGKPGQGSTPGSPGSTDR